MMQINPPPQDNRCERCGRPASELPSVDANLSMPISLVMENSQIKFVTDDDKLRKNFRDIGDENGSCIIPSWECVDCFD